MISLKQLIAVLIIALTMQSPGYAHHANSMFDQNIDMTLSGTVTKFEWTNPHVWIWFMADMPDGSQQEWALESGAPIQLRKAGFKWDSFKSGDKVTFELHPRRSGQPAGQFVRAIFADGRVLLTSDPAAQGK